MKTFMYYAIALASTSTIFTAMAGNPDPCIGREENWNAFCYDYKTPSWCLNGTRITIEVCPLFPNGTQTVCRITEQGYACAIP
ncbi:hypothetical protein F4810DRAFT_654540 [Camillea tinctor]|nr:hypothetical protein F4810DRAFT_654540 [Camillea tinctor]